MLALAVGSVVVLGVVVEGCGEALLAARRALLLPAGAVLGNLPGLENAPPVALSGRVYVYCDASGAAIEPGDLLTTSDTPGHAMKAADHARAQGAVIGKAMTALESGRSPVLVLVSLQ